VAGFLKEISREIISYACFPSSSKKLVLIYLRSSSISRCSWNNFFVCKLFIILCEELYNVAYTKDEKTSLAVLDVRSSFLLFRLQPSPSSYLCRICLPRSSWNIYHDLLQREQRRSNEEIMISLCWCMGFGGGRCATAPP